MAVSLDLVAVLLRLSQCKAMDDVVQVLRETTRELIGADGITVVLRAGEECYYVEENAVGPLWKGKRFPMSACISGWCMMHRQQVVISDIYVDPRIPHDAYQPTFVKSLAMTPIRSADPVGAIGAYWAQSHTATPEQLRMLQALGDSAAMAFENAQLIGQLRETNRRKDEFLAMLAHELRNPLAPISNSLSLLRLQGSNPSALGEAAGVMERQVGQLCRLVDDLLDAARMNGGKVTLKPSRVDLVTLLRQCVQDHRGVIDAAGLRLQLDLPMSRIEADADAARLTQVVGNLLDNACKYTPAGGSVSVSLAADEMTNMARLDVRDTGVGIPPAILSRIFEPFTQADTSLDRSGGGLGLGLAVAKNLVELHGGTIAAQSDGVGRGALFSVSLPCIAAAAEPTAAAPPTKRRHSDNGSRVVIIEDNQDAARTLQKLLRYCGYDAAIAHDGIAGVELVRNERPNIVLCDIGLPQMDGYAVATALRESADTSHVRLIAVTGYGGADDRERARAAGFDAHVVKPIDLDTLLAHMAQGFPVSPTAAAG